MKAMILAAGFGKRMLPLTATSPKPLLQVNNKALLDYHIERLAKAGISEIVINHAYLGEQIVAHIGDASRYQTFGDVSIHLSQELEPLETLGGISKAMPLLDAADNNEPFILLNGDVWCDFSVKDLIANFTQNAKLGHLLLVKNPSHNSGGDFALEHGKVSNQGDETYTFAGVSILTPQLINDYLLAHSLHYENAGALAPLLRATADKGELSGQIFNGDWVDVGTPERLHELNAKVQAAC